MRGPIGVGVSIPAGGAGGVSFGDWDAEKSDDGNVLLLYHMEDNAANTNVTDSAAGSYTGTLSANSSVLNATGIFDDGFNFADTYTMDNTTAGLLTAATSAAQDKGTFEFWAKSNSADWSTTWDGPGACIFTQIYCTNASNFIGINYEPTNDLIRFEYNGQGTYLSVSSSTPVDSISWFHYRITWDSTANEMKCYISESGGSLTQRGTTQTLTTDINQNCTHVTFGIYDPDSANLLREVDCIMDEYAFSKVVRTT